MKKKGKVKKEGKKLLEKKTTVLISYNKIDGFRSGWHAKNKVFICANDKGRGSETGQGEDRATKAGNVMHRLSGSYYHGAVPVKQVEQYYVYSGLHAMRQAIGMAKSLRSESQAPVTVVACNCDAREKENLLQGTGIDLIWCECGGETKMGQLAKATMAM